MGKSNHNSNSSNSSSNKTPKMQFKFVTGTCPNCGGNKYFFDEKEQTFVCEFCNTEVYKGEPVKEEKKVEPKPEPKVEKVEEPKEEPTIHISGGYGYGNPIKGIFMTLVGMMMIAMKTVVNYLGLLDNVEVSSSLAGSSEMMSSVLNMSLTCMMIVGVAMVIFGVYEVAMGMLRGY